MPEMARTAMINREPGIPSPTTALTMPSYSIIAILRKSLG